MNRRYKIAVCVATYRRPAQLLRLLNALCALDFHAVVEPEIEIIVVDNDPDSSASSVFRGFRSSRFRISYHPEPRRGISYARNTAITHGNGSDLVAFIDDDEYPSRTWLDALIAAHLEFNAPIVAGPVVPIVPQPSGSDFAMLLRRLRHPSGTQLQSAGAGNVLISARVLRAMSPTWFDPRFAISGGEDTHFFRRCLAAGFPIVWADDAIVYETVPAARLAPPYLRARARNGANHWTRVEMELHPSLLNLSRRFAAGIARIFEGTLEKYFGGNVEDRMRGDLRLAEGIGNLYAFFGGTYEMYGASER
ncbi:glycosyl transferase, family 2 [Candidatus Koribacter versatilis Ellin345]|uniref:Glycosyl transferase, family 2 n=1 Tax=Koribacter versatilis (strain Ellin345) TaxID=204669 RepID=Q1ING1_KORVE|nr:glycosyltransferase family 2 protein [Candidatus Koribacter versatilis]ABF41589.1 glycosyl transferase, family 2 [Candidatus Koribacter versatilis Ellin345]